MAGGEFRSSGRMLGAERAAMQRMRYRHEVGLSEEHERRAMVEGQLDRADRVLDRDLAVGRPPEDPSAEAVQGGLSVDLAMSPACRSASQSARLRSSTCTSPRVSRRATITSPRDPASSLRWSCIGASMTNPCPKRSEMNHPPCGPGTWNSGAWSVGTYTRTTSLDRRRFTTRLRRLGTARWRSRSCSWPRMRRAPHAVALRPARRRARPLSETL